MCKTKKDPKDVEEVNDVMSSMAALGIVDPILELAHLAEPVNIETLNLRDLVRYLRAIPRPFRMFYRTPEEYEQQRRIYLNKVTDVYFCFRRLYYNEHLAMLAGQLRRKRSRFNSI